MRGSFHLLAYTAVALSTSFFLTSASYAEGMQGDAKRGAETFKTICAHCHTTTYDDSRIGAPGLRGVLERHDEAWLNHWIKEPETFAKTDVAAKDLISSNKFGLAMPTLPAMQDEQNRADIIEFLKTLK